MDYSAAGSFLQSQKLFTTLREDSYKVENGLQRCEKILTESKTAYEATGSFLQS